MQDDIYTTNYFKQPHASETRNGKEGYTTEEEGDTTEKEDSRRSTSRQI